MAKNIQRKCGNCGTWNGDVDHCIHCKTAISIKAQEKIEQKRKIEMAAKQPKDKLDLIAERYKNHPFFLVRWAYHIINSIFMVFMGIGSLIAYFIAWTAG